jgi:uncharacterized membrane protein
LILHILLHPWVQQKRLDSVHLLPRLAAAMLSIRLARRSLKETSMIGPKLTASALLAAVVGAALAAGASAADAPKSGAKEKCYGVTKAGENMCAAANGTHGCASESKASYMGHDWKIVPAGTCEQMNGSLKAFEGANPKMSEPKSKG